MEPRSDLYKKGVIYIKTANNSKVQSFTRSLRGSFVTEKQKKPNVTHLYHKDEYYDAFYFPKNLCIWVGLTSKVERVSKREGAVKLMEFGLSSYMGGKITDYIHAEHAAKELEQKVKPTPFVRVLRRYPKDHGMDISKVI